MRWGNIILGALGLALLQGVVSTGGAASNVGGFIASAGKAVAWFVDPTVPAFANTSTPKTSSTPTPTAVASTATPISPTLGEIPNPSPQTVAQGGAV
jgi:hypothetical protein